jgi:competence protein CoiA
METCLYKGKQICAYDTLDKNYNTKYEIIKDLKIAGLNGKLLCEECGKEVILKIRDPRKKVPHFSHKLTDEKCLFSNLDLKESDNHKRGKMILYSYFKEKYPDADIMINYRFPHKRRADLYVEFYNGNRLAVEYQRTQLNVLDWEEKHKEYENLDINVLWILCGNEEELLLKEKQGQVPFFQQVMLNELEKVAVYLDVKKSKLILAKNMVYSDPYVENSNYEELYVKGYNLHDVAIDTNGKIHCDFLECYKQSNTAFINTHSQKCLEEENIRGSTESFSKLVDQPSNTVSSEKIIEEFKQRDRSKRYYTGFMPYKNKIKLIINGDEEELNHVADRLRENGSDDELEIIATIFKYHYLKGYKGSETLYNKLIERVGLEKEPLVIKEKKVRELVCPICKGNLIQVYGFNGPVIKCRNYPLCKVYFSIL